MKIERENIHADLRKAAGPLMVLNFLLRRRWAVRLLVFMGRLSRGRKIRGIISEEKFIDSRSGGPAIRIRIYRPENGRAKLSAMLYCHAGGFLMGSPEAYHASIKAFIDKRPCIVVAPDYRKSGESPFPAAFNDCYDTLLWMKENADALHISRLRFMLAGHSAGGGLAASLSLKARDTREVDIAFQMPLYPMLDDRQSTDSSLFRNTPVWDSRNNAYAWSCYLKDVYRENAEVPVYAAPARNEDHRNLPPAISFVGLLEPFRDETIAHMEALEEAGIPVEFKVFEGCYHGFDMVAPHSGVGKEALEFTFENYAKFYDIYYHE